MPLQLEIVTSERTVFAGEVDMVTVPGGGGVMGILPQHAPVLSTLKPGELRVRIGGEVQEFAIGGGFIDVHDNHVIILADSAERGDEIDEARAEAAIGRAQELLKNPPQNREELMKIENALRRSQVRLKIAQRHSQRGMTSSS